MSECEMITQHAFPDNLLFQKIKMICKYCISGGIGAIIDFGLYSILIYCFSTNYLISNFISFSCGTLTTYYLQKNWTFQYNTNKKVAVFQRYVLALIGTYILNTGLLYSFIGILNINMFAAKVIQIGISTLWGFTINSIYVFKKNDDNIIKNN